MNGRVSVVIPLYNHERYVAQALESVIAQSLRPFEIIVIDDGSSDRSALIVQEIARHCPEIVFWSHPNQGAHYTINAGIKRARGEFIAVLNSDDVYHPGRLRECIDIFDGRPDVAMVATKLGFIDENGKAIRNEWYEQAMVFYKTLGDLSLALINGNFLMTTSNLVVRRALFHEMGYFSALRYAHDLDFFLRLILHDKRIYLLDKTLINYRLHPTNTISEGALRVKIEWAAVVAFFIYNRGSNLSEAEQDWSYYGSLTSITDKHRLTQLLLYFFKYFDSLPPGELACDTFVRDQEFTRFLAEVVK